MLRTIITTSLDYRINTSLPKVLKAAAWIVGEYSEIVSLIAADTGRLLYHRGNDTMQIFKLPVCIHLSSGSSISTSNPCMHSSLTSSHSYHLLCSSNFTADISDTPQSDSGYWIEGPTGEDIRSSWRGQPIHVLVVDALLHPRATNLPAHVQSAYIQSAMKVTCTLVNN